MKSENNQQTEYLDVAHEVVCEVACCKWNVRLVIIVVIVILAKGPMAKSFDEPLSRISLNGWIQGFIQAHELDTARLVRRFLSLES